MASSRPWSCVTDQALLRAAQAAPRRVVAPPAEIPRRLGISAGPGVVARSSAPASSSALRCIHLDPCSRRAASVTHSLTLRGSDSHVSPLVALRVHVWTDDTRPRIVAYEYQDGVNTMAGRRKVGHLLGLAVLATVIERPMHPYEMATLIRDRGEDGAGRPAAATADPAGGGHRRPAGDARRVMPGGRASAVPLRADAARGGRTRGKGSHGGLKSSGRTPAKVREHLAGARDPRTETRGRNPVGRWQPQG